MLLDSNVIAQTAQERRVETLEMETCSVFLLFGLLSARRSFITGLLCSNQAQLQPEKEPSGKFNLHNVIKNAHSPASQHCGVINL
jgi:hypothetical protein